MYIHFAFTFARSRVTVDLVVALVAFFKVIALDIHAFTFTVEALVIALVAVFKVYALDTLLTCMKVPSQDTLDLVIALVSVFKDITQDILAFSFAVEAHHRTCRCIQSLRTRYTFNLH